MGRQLTDTGVAALKPKATTYLHPDMQTPGLFVRVLPSGSKAFVVVVRHKGKQIWKTLKGAGGIVEAREKARVEIERIKGQADATGDTVETFGMVADQWFARHVEAKGLRSGAETRRLMAKDLRSIEDRRFESVRRGDIAKLLDHVEDTSGTRTADLVLSIISGVCDWYAKRNEDYTSPIIKGMKRYSAKANSRERILTDDEIHSLWDVPGTYGDILRLCLLTGQRREKVASIKWGDIEGDLWTIATDAREKNNAGQLTLPAMALEIINRQPRFFSNPYVFAARKRYFTTWRNRNALNADWVVHDLRRTSRSLMSRAGIRADIAERVLGHAIRGVEGVYDRHQYREEKAHALKALAGLISAILSPEDAKVRRLRG